MIGAWLRQLWHEPATGPSPGTGARRRETLSTAALAAVLLSYANGDAWFWSRRAQTLSSETNYAHLGMLALTLAWAALEGRTPRELGLGRQGLGRGLAWGLILGLLGAVPIRLFFAFPLVSRQAISQPEFEGLSRGRLLWLVGGQFLVGSALFEEVAFRGLLHAKLVRLYGAGRALLLGSAVFAAWHLVITWYNLRRTNLPRPLFPFLYAGALTALFGGGLLFGLVRQASGHLAGSVLAHWLMVANIVLAVARPRRSPRA